MQNKSILIVGANSAIAQALSQRLVVDNTLYFLGREPDKLTQNLASMHLDECWHDCVDARDMTKTRLVIEQAWHAANGFDLVFIAFGLLGEQIPTEINIERAQDVLETNFNAVVSTLITVSQLMENQGQGKIAVISSVAGERGRPRNYTYGAAKAGLTCYLEGLRSRLWHSGVEVYTFKLGPVDTPMTASHHKDFSFSTTAQVTQRMLTLLEGKRYSAYVPAFWGPIMWVVRWLPEAIFQRLPFLSGR